MRTRFTISPDNRLVPIYCAPPNDGGAGGGGGTGGGGGGEGGDGGGGAGGAGGDGGGGNDPKLLPQDQVDTIVAREKAAAKRQALQAFADELGVTIDEAKDIVKRQKDAEEAEASEAERARRAAEAEKAAAAAERTTLRRERQDLAIEKALLGAKVKDDRLAAATRFVRPEIGDDLDGDELTAAVTAAVEKAKETVPEFFGTATPPPPGGDPGPGPGRRGNDGKTGIEAGREAARQRQEQGKTADPLERFQRIGS